MSTNQRRMERLNTDIQTLESLQVSIESSASFGGLDDCSNDIVNVVLSTIKTRHNTNVDTISAEDNTRTEMACHTTSSLLTKLTELRTSLNPE